MIIRLTLRDGVGALGASRKGHAHKFLQGAGLNFLGLSDGRPYRASARGRRSCGRLFSHVRLKRSLKLPFWRRASAPARLLPAQGM